MATEQQVPRRWIDDKTDRQLDRDVAEAYASVTKSMEGKSGPVAVLQRIGKLWLKWDTEPRPKTRARNALKQLTGVPAAQNSNWNFESSMREGLRSAMDEEAEAETDRWNKFADGGKEAEGYLKEKQTNDTVRRIFRDSIRVDADASDIARINAAVKKLKDDGEGEDL